MSKRNRIGRFKGTKGLAGLQRRQSRIMIIYYTKRMKMKKKGEKV